MIEFQSSHPLFSQLFQQILCREEGILPTQQLFFLKKKNVFFMLHRIYMLRLCVCLRVCTYVYECVNVSLMCF